MKRWVLVIFVATCAAALVPQGLEAGTWFKSGFSLARFDQTSTEELPFAWGNLPYFVVGVSSERGLGVVSLQSEVLYVRMGGKYTIVTDNALEYRFNYIQVPVMIKLNIIPFGPVRPFVAGGVYGSYLIKAQGVMKVAGETTKADFTADYKRLDYGLVGGAGLSFRLPGFSISVEGRYNYGLMNIMKDPAAGDALKNRSLMALLGISY
ncbi:MAG: porin family protein [Candidatus Aminicenantales bacterium]